MKATFKGVELIDQILIFLESDDCNDELLRDIYLKCYPKQTVTITLLTNMSEPHLNKFEIDGIE